MGLGFSAVGLFGKLPFLCSSDIHLQGPVSFTLGSMGDARSDRQETRS